LKDRQLELLLRAFFDSCLLANWHCLFQIFDFYRFLGMFWAFLGCLGMFRDVSGCFGIFGRILATKTSPKSKKQPKTQKTTHLKVATFLTQT
jgi:hypothetical protein